jgi:glucose-6-phosphate isomerase
MKAKIIHEFPPALAAINNYNLIKQGINQNIMMPYSDSLLNFSMWFRQLWGESLGKDGKGSTPISGLGTIDQHSQLQLYLDGPKDKFVTIISLKNKKKSRELNCRVSKNFIYKNLHKKTMNDLLTAETIATFETLKKKNIPIRMIELESNKEETIGSLLMHFFLETIFTCYLLEVNPFDQPAVEEGKKLAIKYLNHGKNQTSF